MTRVARRFLGLAILCSSCTILPQPAELILTGGVIWTGTSQTGATAIALRGGRIAHVGSDEEVRRYIGAQTTEIELAGRLVVPGFIDDHAHFLSGGAQLGSVDLRPAVSPADFTQRLATYARTLPEGRWITGGDWDHEAWPGGPLPRREWIDSVTPAHPVSVNRLDGHMVLVNSVALRLARITRDTPDPPGGTIVRDPRTGEPTGVLKDAAMSLLDAVLPSASDRERDESFRRAQAHALSLGVTMVTDMGDFPSLSTYRQAHASKELVLRIYAFVPINRWKELQDLIARQGSGDARLRWGGVKGFVDGSLGSTTAWFHEPFTDAPATSGLMVTDTGQLRQWILDADGALLQVAVHAIGDRANDWLLDTYQWVGVRNGSRDRRFRIEHAQHLTRTAIPRFASLGVLPSMQPYHAIDDGRWAEKRIGPERIKTTYAFKSLLGANAGLMFGSDWSVAPLDPIQGIYAAVTRRTLDGRYPSGWVPEEKITVEEALRAYTSASAFGAFVEKDVGTLQQGKRADLVVLSENLLTIEPNDIQRVRVDYTLIDGKIVHRRTN